MVNDKCKGTLIELNNYEYIWDDKEKLTLSILECSDNYEFFLEEVSTKLNNIHRINKSKQYYRILIGNWLLFYIHTCWDRYTSVLIYGEEIGSIGKLDLSKSNAYIPYDFNDFAKKTSSSDLYNLQLYTKLYDHIFSKNNLPTVEIEWESGERSKRHSRGYKHIIFSFLSYIVKKTRKEYILITEPYFKEKSLKSIIKLIFYTGFRVAFENKSKCFPHDSQIKDDLRCALRVETDDKFRQFIANNILSDMPIIFLENYKESRLKALNNYLKIPKVIYTSTALHANFNIKFLLAEYHKEITVISQQHGATYGLNHIHSMEEYEKSISDIYLTAGWVDSKKCIPFCIPRLCNNSKNQENSSQILFVPTYSFSYITRLEYYPRSQYYRTRYFDLMACFLKGLKLPNELSNLMIRPYPNPYSLKKIQGIIDKYHLTHSVSKCGSIEQSIVNSKLVVMDHLGTTMLDTMSRNIPTVVFCDPKIQKYRNGGLNIIKELIECKILHESPDLAYQHINHINSNVEKWWGTATVQNARMNFVSKYARNIKEWEKELALIMKHALNDNELHDLVSGKV
jgi:putative transferase (TIGR04331 family)